MLYSLSFSMSSGAKRVKDAALAAVSELTLPFLVLSELASLPNNPALQKFAEVPGPVSFTDYLVMAIADDYHTKDIFGFDKQFEDACTAQKLDLIIFQTCL
jgi:predicted nucleic acid-binding protein